MPSILTNFAVIKGREEHQSFGRGGETGEMKAQTAAKNCEGLFVVSQVSRKWITILNQSRARNSCLCLRFRDRLSS